MLHKGTIVMLALVLGLGAARADDKEAAREAYKAGSRYFEIGDYKSALDRFKEAYLSFEDAAILFNIAQCQRLLGQKQEALRSYRIYLQKQPDGPNHAEIENIVATLEEAIRKDEAAATMPPTGVESARGGATQGSAAEPPGTAPPPGTPPPPAATTPPPAAAANAGAPAEAPRDRTPLYKKWWLWAAVGGVVVVGVAVGVGVGVAANSHPDFKPTQPEIGPGARMATSLMVSF